MISIHSLIKRMRKAKNVECGLDFNINGAVTLWWQLSLTKQYTITLEEHQLSVECNDFQRGMMKAELDMKG